MWAFVYSCHDQNWTFSDRLEAVRPLICQCRMMRLISPFVCVISFHFFSFYFTVMTMLTIGLGDMVPHGLEVGVSMSGRTPPLHSNVLVTWVCVLKVGCYWRYILLPFGLISLGSATLFISAGSEWLGAIRASENAQELATQLRQKAESRAKMVSESASQLASDARRVTTLMRRNSSLRQSASSRKSVEDKNETLGFGDPSNQDHRPKDPCSPPLAKRYPQP